MSFNVVCISKTNSRRAPNVRYYYKPSSQPANVGPGEPEATRRDVVQVEDERSAMGRGAEMLKEALFKVKVEIVLSQSGSSGHENTRPRYDFLLYLFSSSHHR